MAYIDFPEGLKGQKERKAFWLSDKGLVLIGGWRRNGIPLTKIIDEYIGVSRTAFWGWYKQSEALQKVSKESRETTNMTVEEALFRKAVGFYYEEEVYELVEGEMMLTKKYKKYCPPDTKAIMHWLWNKMPAQWRAMQEPLESTQYKDTVKNILVAMKEVADGITDSKVVEVVPPEENPNQKYDAVEFEGQVIK